MAFTPGPWWVAFEPGKYVVIGAESHCVAMIPNDGGEREPIRVENAHLIAAAPELLEALREACIAHNSANGTKPPQSWLLAVAKAEGRA